MRDALPAVCALRERYDDARILPSALQLPMPLFGPVRIEQLRKPPVHPAAIVKRALPTVSYHLRSPAPPSRDRPQINVPARNARWLLLSMVDPATVSNADGSGVAFRKRDPQQFRALLARTVVLTAGRWRSGV
ncbi:MAG TPA: hypothetical protein VE645_05580 [Pseudonocardiaceae bacterium]|nr:hypothetical protein [Pseudonocardiaceae bacterium]